jgi:hypothetical protein
MNTQLVIDAFQLLEDRMVAVEAKLSGIRRYAESPELCSVIETVQGMANCIRWCAEDLQQAAMGETPAPVVAVSAEGRVA